MAKIFTIEKGPQLEAQAIVASGTAASIGRGVPTKSTESDATATGVLAVMADADGLVTGERFGGIAKAVSTETAAAAGIVEVFLPLPGMLYRGFAKSATAFDTQAEINALFRKRVLFDLTTGDWTVDTGAADALANCVVIVGGYPQSSEVLFYYSPKGTILDTSTVM